MIKKTTTQKKYWEKQKGHAMRILLLSALFLLLACETNLQTANEVPRQSEYLRGELDNGLQYSIRANDQSKNRMTFYLAVNAGSLQEEEDQRGLAHFLEHMAFNGSEHFPGNSLVEFAQQNGMRFGAHLNAYTSFEETVYRFALPSDDAELRDRGLYVMHDWLDGLNIAPKEVEKERGVVLSEWRGSLGFSQDYQNIIFPLILKGSKFAERLPIGLPEVIENAPAQRLRDFYEKWYNTKNAIIVVVGDFDVNVMEQRVKEIFSDIEPRGETLSSGPERQRENVPLQNELRAASMQHGDAPERSISLEFKGSRLPVGNTVDRMRQKYLNILLQLIAQVRFAESVKKHSDTVSNMYGFGSLKFGNSESNDFTVVAQKGKLKQAYQILLQMIAQFKKYGVQQSEMDLAIKTLRKQLELSYEGRNDLPNSALAKAEVEDFLGNSYNADITWIYENQDALVAPIRLEQINRRIKEIFSSKDVSILALAKDKRELPSEEELKRDYLQLGELEVAALQNEQTLPKSLLQELPEPGTIVAERELPETGFSEWTLSNGLKVYLKETDFELSKVQFMASRLGGVFDLGSDFAPLSLTNNLLNRVVSASGFSGLSPEEFHRYLLTLKMANGWTFDVGTTSLSGYSSLSHLQELFQQVYLSFTAPQFSQALIDQALKDLATELDNMQNTPDRYTIRLASEDVYQNDSRVLLPRSFPQNYNAKELQQAFSHVVPSAKDFSFIFVGKLKTAADKRNFRKYVEQYIASLPTEKSFEYDAEKNLLSLYEEGKVSEFPLGPEDQSITYNVWDGYLEVEHFADEQDYRMHKLAKALGSLLNIRFTRTLREEMGKTYSPSAYVDFRSKPKNRVLVRIFYNAAPPDVPILEETIREILRDIQAGRISDDDFAKVKQQLQKGREEDIQKNDYWVGSLNSGLLLGYKDIDTVLSDAYFEEVLTALSKKDLQDFSNYITWDRWSRYTMLPKK